MILACESGQQEALVVSLVEDVRERIDERMGLWMIDELP
jgi:hypothetical protein